VTGEVKSEDERALLEFSLEIIKDLSSDIRHCDIIAGAVITASVTFLVAMFAIVETNSFTSLPSAIAVFILGEFQWLLYFVALGLRRRVLNSSSKLREIKSALVQHYPLLNIQGLQVSGAVDAGPWRTGIPYLYDAIMVMWVGIGIGVILLSFTRVVVVLFPRIAKLY
jgi:hypothetical protein